MKRQTNPQLDARRCEFVKLAHKGWTQTAIASHSFLLCDLVGDPPYQPLGALKAEHYAALVAEFERDPYQNDLLIKDSERKNSTAGDDGQDLPDGPGQPPVSPENLHGESSRGQLSSGRGDVMHNIRVNLHNLHANIQSMRSNMHVMHLDKSQTGGENQNASDFPEGVCVDFRPLAGRGCR